MGRYWRSVNVLGLDHAAGFVFTAPPLSENCVNLVDEDDAWLQFPCQTEYRVNELVAVAVPLFCQSRDVQVDEAGARFVCEGFCKHSLSATGRTVEEDAAGCAEERGRVRVEVGHGKGVDDGFLEFVDYRVEATDICEVLVLHCARASSMPIGMRQMLQPKGQA